MPKRAFPHELDHHQTPVTYPQTDAQPHDGFEFRRGIFREIPLQSASSSDVMLRRGNTLMLLAAAHQTTD